MASKTNKSRFGDFYGVRFVRQTKYGKVRKAWAAVLYDRGLRREVMRVFAIGLRPEREAWLLAMHARREAEERLPGLRRNKWPELPPAAHKCYRRPKQPDRTAESAVEELKAYRDRCRDSDLHIARHIGISPTLFKRWLKGRHKPPPQMVKKIRRFLSERL